MPYGRLRNRKIPENQTNSFEKDSNSLVNLSEDLDNTF
jgi:hypothetical protein